MNGKKQELRSEFLKKRGMLDSSQIRLHSEAIWESVYKIESFKKAKTIGIYVSFNKEINTFSFIESLLERKKNVMVPKVIKEEKQIKFYKINSLEELKPGIWGILEPQGLKEKKISSEEIEAMIVPGLVFNKKGYRIGYGGGYYDRYLENKPWIYKIGVCFEFQLVNMDFHSEYDIPVNEIVTEVKNYSV